MSDNKTIPEGQIMPIAVRAYVCKNEQTSNSNIGKKQPQKIVAPSEWALVFDTETTTDASQKLRLGTYQVRKKDDLIEAGIFYAPDALTQKELTLLKEYARKHQQVLKTVSEFIDETFHRVGYKYRASIVGFNLPFDISRLAIDHAPARTTKYNKIMHGGFTFKLSDKPEHPRVQIKHISSRNAFIQFAATRKQRTSRGNRKKGRFHPIRRGFFIDAKTLAAALTSQSHSLASLAEVLDVEAQKFDTEDHGCTLTEEYIDYAVQDTQTTWECYTKLKSLYDLHGLQLTPAHKIQSEASLGKAYLRDMGVQPWKKIQPDFPNEIVGNIMSAYYGGRSEVHIRKESTQVLYCDFLSMYPTVCTLMGLWRFVIAQGMTWKDSTQEIQKFLNKISVDDLQKQETWQSLCTLVQVIPDKDIFPVRARYSEDAQYTIGLNFLTSRTPLWFTLADCISSKLLTGKTPQILQATSFTPNEIQEDLKPVCVAGDIEYSVDPCHGDFFKRIIDLRREVKKNIKSASKTKKSALENKQLALKILANATSYGIFVELNPEQNKQLQPILCYGHGGQAIPIQKKKFETAGMFFHPLLATLITGAARLMLAITEKQTLDAGLDWAFCDTDSMALAKPENMSQDTFYKKACHVQEWFTALNPYEEKEPLLKIEEYNYNLSQPDKLKPLYCFAVSSKRYALFNLDAQRKLSLRKVSAHGLGHLIAPYYKKGDEYLDDVQAWQQDFWLEIIMASQEKRLPDFTRIDNFDMPAVSRYGATTPVLEKWFQKFNEDKPYCDRVKPFNFLLAMQALPEIKSLKPVSPYHKDRANDLLDCFDRMTGDKVTEDQLKTYLDSLAQYHLRPEAKFLNADFLDKGKTQRRHITAKSIQHIGKEANKWEEQFFIGFDPSAQIEYGICPKQKSEMLKIILRGIKKYGANKISKIANLSHRHVLNISHGNTNISENTLEQLYSAVIGIDVEFLQLKNLRKQIQEKIKKDNISVRKLGIKLGIDPSNLSKIISGQRNNSNLLHDIYNLLI